MNRYRCQVFSLMTEMLTPQAPYSKALDFGAGDGWFAGQLHREGLAEKVHALDVKERKFYSYEVSLYREPRLPFADGAFDLVYSIDALHHCSEPLRPLNELLRCCRSHLLVKDHTYGSWLAKAMLIALDEAGNRRWGIPCPRHYQKQWNWVEYIEARGFRRLTLVHPAPVHTGILGRTTNHLQFLGLWKRV